MRRALRFLGLLMILGGLLGLGWTVLVWQWQDPFTAYYTHRQQSRLAAELDRRDARFQTSERRGQPLAAARRTVSAEAARYRRSLHRGDPVGRLTIGAIGLRVVVVQGTDRDSLKKGPGHYAGSLLPGQGGLVYLAGHRTTYLAPFSHIDTLKPGDRVVLELPYGTFRYVVTGHRIVRATDAGVLRPRRREELVLQACHPRFFASHRYLVYARPAAMELPGGTTYAPGKPAEASS